MFNRMRKTTRSSQQMQKRPFEKTQHSQQLLWFDPQSSCAEGMFPSVVVWRYSNFKRWDLVEGD
jgi:hypothetical protein